MRLRVKGINDGILITMPEGDWEEACVSLKETIDEKPEFFDGAALYLDMGMRELRAADLSWLRNGLESYGIHMKGVLSKNEKTIQNCISLGLMTEKSATKKSFKEKTPGDAKKSEPSILYLEKNIRSGTSISSKAPIVIIGDVHPGAEVTSEKSVTIWGVIRGNVTAGTPEGTPESIRGLGIENARLTVNGVSRYIKTEKPDRKNKGERSPFLAMVKGNDLVLETK